MYDTHPSLRLVKEMILLHALPSDLRASVVKLHAGTKEVQDDRQQICINGIVSDADYGRDLYSTVTGAEKKPNPPLRFKYPCRRIYGRCSSPSFVFYLHG